jgi:hypothetical protein
MKVILSVPDEGYFECTCWRLFWVYLMKVILSVPDDGYSECTWWRLFWVYLMKVILSVPDEGYFECTKECTTVKHHRTNKLIIYFYEETIWWFKSSTICNMILFVVLCINANVKRKRRIRDRTVMHCHITLINVAYLRMLRLLNSVCS